LTTYRIFAAITRRKESITMSVEAARGPGAWRSWVKVLVLTLIIAVPATVLGPILWSPVGMQPTHDILPFFIVESFIEAISLGLGVSFLIFGLSLVRGVEPRLRLRAWLMYLSNGWFLVSWWPHSNLHVSNGDDMQRLLYIEYGFHVALIIAGAVLAYCFLSIIRERSKKQWL
jgi:hypothetical protein